MISYSETNSCGTVASTKSVTVLAAPATPAPIGGTPDMCMGASTTLTESTPGGVWSVFSPLVATISSGGVVTGLTLGTDSVYYTISNACGSTVASVVVSVNTLPAVPAAIGGTLGLCMGSTTSLTESVAGGTWSSLTPSVAMVSVSGIVSGVSGGTDSVKYTIANGCGSNSVGVQVTVNPLPPAPAAITGTFFLCTGANVTLSDGTSGGNWISANPSVATISGSGVVTGVAGGTDTIKYAVTNMCGASYATHVITINTVPASPVTPTGSNSICTGTTTTWTDATGGGTWAATNPAIASITSGGVITAGIAGVTTISYTVSNTCGSTTLTTPITINTIPVPPAAITGTLTLCPGTNTTLADVSPSGVWTSTSTGVATISASGVVTGVSAGTSLISYGLANICGSAFATTTVTVNPLPNAGVISGGTSVLCYLSSTTYTETVTGGTWSVSNPGVATINTSGVLSGVAAGAEIVSYSYTNSCGTAVATASLSVTTTAYAGTLTGPSSLCTAIPTTYTDPVSGGTWSVSGASATISGGVLYASAAGTDSVIYTTVTPCGTAYTFEIVTINVSPVAGTISGPTDVCVGSTVTVTDPATGGAWSISDTTLALFTSGVVTTTYPGVLTINYTVSTACGTAVASSSLTIDAMPSGGMIAGPAEICVGAPTTFLETATWGIWSISPFTTATISASGIATGVSTGPATITFTQTNACGTASATFNVTVKTVPAVPAAISGTDSVCAGYAVTLTDATTGGTWTSSNANGTIWSPGIVYGNTVGWDTILYSKTNVCGTSSAKFPLHIVPATHCWPTETGNITVANSVMTVYPNPSNGTFTVQLPAGLSAAVYTVTDAMGRTVSHVAEMTGANGTFPVQLGAKPGTYVLKVTAGDQVFRTLITVE
jgi:trimeric autotransporter adhesin